MKGILLYLVSTACVGYLCVYYVYIHCYAFSTQPSSNLLSYITKQQNAGMDTNTNISEKTAGIWKRTSSKQNHAKDNERACEASEYRRRLPDVNLIGERKCGTTVIRNFLDKLSTRVQCAAGEPHFFDKGHVLTKSLNGTGLSPTDLERYLAMMPLSCPSDITFEKTPKYFHTPGTSAAIHKWNPKVKLMVSLKDPIKRAVSDFHFILRFYEEEKKYFKNYTFEQLAVTKEGKINTSFSPLDRSVYDTKFDKWLELFPLEQIHVIDADILGKDPPTELMKIEQYLGLEPECTPDKFEYNETKGYYCMKGEECIGKGHSYSVVDEHVVEILKEYFRPHVIRLQKLIKTTLSWMPRYLAIHLFPYIYTLSIQYKQIRIC